MIKTTKNFIVYHNTKPFAGYIMAAGRVDPTAYSDGSTMKEHIQYLLSKYPGAAVKLFPYGPLPDREKKKFVANNLVDLAVTDITPKKKRELERAKMQQDIADNLPAWAQVQAAINSINTLQQAKVFLKKLTRIVYWLAKNQED